MCKPYLFLTHCVCRSCGRETASSELQIFPRDRCANRPRGTQPKDCPFLAEPTVHTTFAGLYSSSSSTCRRTVLTQLRNSTGALFDALQTVSSDLIQSEARAEFDEVDRARGRLRVSLRNLKEALGNGNDGDLPRARLLLEEVSRDAVMIRDRSERLENVRERVSHLLQGMVDDTLIMRDRAAALLEERPSPIHNEGEISDGYHSAE
ncbi:hypothetical protein PG990_011126 [Apiospora arundinis]